MMSENQEVSSDEEHVPFRGIPIPRGRPELQKKIAKMKESILSDDEDPLSPYGSPREVSAFGGRGKFLELKKKLEDDQANRSTRTASSNEHQTDSSSTGVIDVETLLESIRNDLETRDQSRLSNTTIRNLETHPKFLEMYQQIKERDHTILNLESRLNDMDRQVIDLQDTVNQRDKLIGSKNEAVSVVHSKYQKELEVKENELRKTQETMISLEKNLSGIQDQWKVEKDRLNSEIKGHRDRLENMTDTNKALEAKCDVIQEELARLRTENEENKALVLKKDEEAAEKDVKLNSLTESLEKSTLQLSKLKLQFQTKLKAMKEKQQELVKEAEDAGKVKELENRIAELEEEKGTLLLQQIDFDEEQLGQEQIKTRVQDLEAEVATSAEKITSLTATVSSLEVERDKLTSELNELRESYNELQKSTDQVEQLEAAAAVNIYESESSTTDGVWKEEKDSLNQEIQENESKKLEALLAEKSIMEEEINRLRQWNTEFQTLISTNDSETIENRTKIEELEKALETSKTQVNRLKLQYQTKLKAMRERQKELTEKTEDTGKVTELENRIAELEVEKGNHMLQDTMSPDDVKTRLRELEAQAKISSETISNLTQNIITIETERERITSELYEKEDRLEQMTTDFDVKVQELQAEITRLQQSVKESEKIEVDKEDLEAKIQNLTAENIRLSELATQVKVVSAEKAKMQEATAETSEDSKSDPIQPEQSSESQWEEIETTGWGFQELEAEIEPLSSETLTSVQVSNESDPVEASNSQLQESLDQIAQLQAEILRLQELSNQVPLLQAEVTRLQGSQDRVTSLQSEISRLQESANQVHVLKGEIYILQDAVNQVAELQAKVSRYEQNGNELQIEIDTLRESVAQFKELDSEVAHLREQVQEIEQLRIENAMIQESLEYAQDEKKIIEEKLAQIEQSNKDYVQEIASKDEQIAAKNNELESLKTQASKITVTEPEAVVSTNKLSESVTNFMNWEDNPTQGQVQKSFPAGWWSGGWDEDQPEIVQDPISKERPFLTNEPTSAFEEVQIQDITTDQHSVTKSEFEYEQMVTERQHLEYQVQNLTAENNRLTELAHQVEALKIENSNLQAAAHERVEKLKVEISELQQLAESRVAELQTTSSRLAQLETEIRELQSENSRLLQSTDQSKELEAKTSQLQEATNRLTYLEKDNLSLYEAACKLGQLQKEIPGFQHQIEVLQLDINYWKELAEQVPALQAEIAKLKESADQIPALQSEIISLKESADQVLELQAEIAKLKESADQVPALQSEIISLKESADQVPALQSEITNLKESAKKVPELEAEISELEEISKEIPLLKAEISELQKSASQVPLFKTEISTLQASANQVHALKAEILSLQESANQVPRLQAGISFLEEAAQQVPALQAEIVKLQDSTNRVSELEAEITKLQESANQVPALKDEINKLQDSANQVSALQAEIANLKEASSQVPALQAEIDNLQDYANQVPTLQAEIAKLQDAANQLAQLKPELSNLQEKADQVHQLQVEISNLQEKIDQLESNNFKLKVSASQVEPMQAEIWRLQEISNEVEALRMEVEVHRHSSYQVQHLSAEVNRLQEQVQEIDTLRAEYEMLQQSLEYLQTEKNTLEASLAKSEKLNKEYVDTIAGKDTEITHINNELATALQAAKAPRTEPVAEVTTSKVSESVDKFMNWEENQGQGRKASQSGWWSSAFDEEPVVEEGLTKKKSFLTNQDPTTEAGQTAENKVYNLEVQLAEVQISLEEANSQVSEMSSTLEIVSFENSRLQDENLQLKRETEVLKEKVKVNLSISPSPEPRAESSPAGQNLDEGQFELAEAAKKKLTTEVHELKLRNGKLIKNFKQLKEKYDALLKVNEKKEFSLESALEDELVSIVKEKDEALTENVKIIHELRGEKETLSKKVDIIERANEKLIEMKEYQERRIEQLVNETKQLQQEISGLKWRLEEVENMASNDQSGDDGFSSYSNEGSNNIVQANLVASQEIQRLQQENFHLFATVEQLNARNQELSNLQTIQTAPAPLPVQTQAHEVVQTQVHTPVHEDAVDSLNTSIPTAAHPAEELSGNLQTLQQCFEQEVAEKAILERKIELLQGKILEIEQSEMKCFEESLMLKSWTRQLEVDNQKFQLELEQLYGSGNDSDMNSVKVKILQSEVMRLVDVLQDRDKRCEQLTAEITHLLEERDGLQLKLSNVLQHNISLHEENSKGKPDPPGPEHEVPIFDRAGLRMKLAELEEVNYAINIDLRREKEARRLVQEQLFFSQSTRGLRGELKKPASPTSSQPPSNYSSPSRATSPKVPIISPAQFVPIQPVQPSTPIRASEPSSDIVSDL